MTRSTSNRLAWGSALGALVIGALMFAAVVLGVATHRWHVVATRGGHATLVVATSADRVAPGDIAYLADAEGHTALRPLRADEELSGRVYVPRVSVPAVGHVLEGWPSRIGWAIGYAVVTAGALFVVTRSRRPVRLPIVFTTIVAVLSTATPALASFTVPTANRPSALAVMIGGTLGTPSSLTCAWTGATTVRLDWTPAASTMPSGHEIRRKTDAGSYTSLTTVTPHATATYTDTSATAGHTYSYKTREKLQLWESPESNEVVSTGCSAPLVSTIAKAPAATQVDAPEGMALDASGQYLYIADTGNHRIRKVDLANNSITTVAGDGTTGYSAAEEGNAATAASLNSPEAVFVVGSGASAELYITDTGHHMVRKVDTSGNIYKIAGTGSGGFSGDGGDPNAAKLDRPAGIAVTSNGDVFIADDNNNRLRWIDVSDTPDTITTVAGQALGAFADGTCTVVPSNCKLNGLEGLAVDTSDNVYIADKNNRRIRKMTTTGDTFVMTTVAGTGSSGYSSSHEGVDATTATIDEIESVAIASDGDIIIGDAGNNRVRRVDVAPSPDTITTIGGDGSTPYAGYGYPATATSVKGARGVAATSTVYIADTDHDVIRRITTDSAADGGPRLVAVAGTGTAGFADGAPAADAGVKTPASSAINTANGNVYFADSADHRIRMYIAATGTIATIAGTGVSGATGDTGAATAAQINAPQGVAVDSATGDFWIADTGNHKIRKVTASSGTISTVAGTGTACTVAPCGDGGAGTAAKLSQPADVVLTSTGDVIISDSGTHTIRKLSGSTITNLAGGLLTSGSTDATGSAARFTWPYGLGIAANNDVYVADSGTAKIRKVTTGGVTSTVAGGGTVGDVCDGDGDDTPTTVYLNGTTDVAVNGTDFYVTTGAGYRVCKMSGSTATTYMGNGTSGTTGDGGNVWAALVEAANGISISSTYGMYVSHGTTTGRVRKISPPL